MIITHQHRLFILFLLIILSACKQKKSEPLNPFKILYALDRNRANVADSLKYLIPILDSILESDQEYRYGTSFNPQGKAEQEKALERFQSHQKEVKSIDSINLVKVTAILDRYGWLGPKMIGQQESNAIFYVLQHSGINAQEKYLPLLKKAVLEKKESPHHLTMMEDRVSLKRNNYQVYGTQLIYDYQTKRYYLLPVIDPEKILERRNAIGLDSGSLQSYLDKFHVKWDLETYKIELPFVEELRKQQK